MSYMNNVFNLDVKFTENQPIFTTPTATATPFRYLTHYRHTSESATLLKKNNVTHHIKMQFLSFFSDQRAWSFHGTKPLLTIYSTLRNENNVKPLAWLLHEDEAQR